MTTKPEIEELADYEDVVVPDRSDEEQAEQPFQWSGRASKIALAPGANVLRDFEWVTAGSECIDCLKRGKHDRTHAFHARASKVDGIYRGPEGPHIEDLRRQGFLRNTPEAARRLQEQERIAAIRGTERDTICRQCSAEIERDRKGLPLAECPNHHRNGLEELKPRSLAEMKRLWANSLPHEKALEIEKAQLRDEIKGLKEAMSEGLSPLVEALRDVLAIKESRK